MQKALLSLCIHRSSAMPFTAPAPYGCSKLRCTTSALPSSPNSGQQKVNGLKTGRMEAKLEKKRTIQHFSADMRAIDITKMVVLCMNLHSLFLFFFFLPFVTDEPDNTSARLTLRTPLLVPLESTTSASYREKTSRNYLHFVHLFRWICIFQRGHRLDKETKWQKLKKASRSHHNSMTC